MRRWRGHVLVFIACIAVGIASCGDDTPTLAEYALQLEDAVAEMRTRILATDDALAQRVASLAEMEAIWRERVAAREGFLAALEVIDPPDTAVALHAAAADILQRLADAEAAVGDQVRDYEALSQLTGLGVTPPYRAWLAVNEEATNICLAAQGRFDDTRQREILADVPWVTGELKEVVEVVFDCVPNDS